MTARMGYAELFAAIAQRYAGSFHIGVGTWRHVHSDGESVVTTKWDIAFDIARGEPVEGRPGCRIATGATPDEALAAFDAALCAPISAPAGDQTGVSELIGTAEVQS